MSTNYHDTPVREFHEAFGQPVVWHPTVPPLDRRILRAKLIFEEFLEYLDASGLGMIFNTKDKNPQAQFFEIINNPDGTRRQPDMIEAADGLADLRYVVDGSNLEWGFPGSKILREVHRSNMSKLGEDGKPIRREDGKVLKGPHFTPPDIASILELYKGIPR